MASIGEHYENMPARHYTWMRGDYDSNMIEYRDLLRSIGLSPGNRGRAFDLGAGTGFQSVALADLGFGIVGVDQSERLLEEPRGRAGGRGVRTVLGDIRDPRVYEAHAPFEVAVCMGDTLPHLISYDEVAALLENMRETLQDGGTLVLEFRDHTTELNGADRAIPVRLDEDKIMTTFLEYEPEYVNVHDMVVTREASGWRVEKSAYAKLRLGPEKVLNLMDQSGFQATDHYDERGFSVIVGQS